MCPSYKRGGSRLKNLSRKYSAGISGGRRKAPVIWKKWSGRRVHSSEPSVIGKTQERRKKGEFWLKGRPRKGWVPREGEFAHRIRRAGVIKNFF